MASVGHQSLACFLLSSSLQFSPYSCSFASYLQCSSETPGQRLCCYWEIMESLEGRPNCKRRFLESCPWMVYWSCGPFLSSLLLGRHEVNSFSDHMIHVTHDALLWQQGHVVSGLASLKLKDKIHFFSFSSPRWTGNYSFLPSTTKSLGCFKT